MDRDRFARVKDLFRRALPLDAAGRDQLLRGVCQDEDGARAEVLELLAHADSVSSGFLAGANRSAVAAPHAALEIPGFRILGVIAAGGAGVVYRAEQDAPRREVAVKVLRLDTLGPGQVARFQREAEILGSLAHPGIAQVHGAGVVQSGPLALPWIAMELVRGVPLDDYVREQELDTRAVLELFRDLCAAVDHAHERGIVHRDLKSSNVLVEPGGRPRVLDFGIALELGEAGELPARSTRTGMLVGTLATMSPEQARGDRAAIDARADVYALGVLLHEALAGRPPIDVDGLDVIEAVHAVCTVEPERLSAVRPDLPADLGSIVAKAIEKERARRYASAGALGADLANLLAHRPVRARPSTRLDRARKFVRRNRVLTTAVSAVVAALSVGLAVSLAALRNQSRQQAVTSETIDFLARRMTALAPQLGFGEMQRADLEDVVARVERQLEVDPTSRALRAARAQTLYKLASLDQAAADPATMRARLETALAIRAELTREDALDVASWSHASQICAKLGEAARDLGDRELRDAWFARAMEIDERLVREHPEDLEYVEDLGWSLARRVAAADERGEHAEAERLSLRRLADARRLVDRDPASWKFAYNLSEAHSAHAHLLRRGAAQRAALEHSLECARLARRARELDPERRNLVEWFVLATRFASHALRNLGELEAARTYAEDALSAAEALAIGDPRRDSHLVELQFAATEMASADLGTAHPARVARATASLRRVAGVAARAGAHAQAARLNAVADSLSPPVSGH